MAKPVHIQTPTAMRAQLLRPRSKSQALGVKPGTTAERRALSVPTCGSAGGWYMYMNFQMTPAATKEMAMGTKMAAFTAEA